MRYCIYLLLQSVFSFVAEMGEELEELSLTPLVRTDSGHVLFTDRSASDQSIEAPASAVITKVNNLDAPMYCYTVAVGKKPSRASQYVDDARDAANLLITMAGGDALSTMKKRSMSFEGNQIGIEFFS